MAIVAQDSRSLEMADGRLYEVVHGEIEEKVVGTRQNLIAARINRLTGRFDPQEEHGHAVIENLFLLDAASNLQRRPDFAFVSRQRWPDLPPDTNAWNVVPDWMVEIISPTKMADEVDEYFYFHAGTRLVWVIYPHTQRVYAYQSPTEVIIFKPADELTAAPVWPTFCIQVRALFEGIAVPVDRR